MNALRHDDKGLQLRFPVWKKKKMEAVTAPCPWWRRTIYTPVWKYGGDDNPFPVMTKDCTHTCLKISSRPLPLPSDDEGMYMHTCLKIWRRPQPLPSDDEGMNMHTFLKIWRRPQPLPSDDEGMYMHTCLKKRRRLQPLPLMTNECICTPVENMESITAPSL